MVFQIEIPVPPENRYHSTFACLVSKELSTEANPPMMMGCGHVISKDSLQKLNKSGGYVYNMLQCMNLITLAQSFKMSLLSTRNANRIGPKNLPLITCLDYLYYVTLEYCIRAEIEKTYLPLSTCQRSPKYPLNHNDPSWSRCQILPTWKDRGTVIHNTLLPVRPLQAKYHFNQEFRADLHAAETKDKKFVKRKTVLKKIVANITMGNDSWYRLFVYGNIS